VLTAFDPYVAIDIDDKPENPASEEERVVHRRVLGSFQSYTERSVGARWSDTEGNERGGYHVILRGKMCGGRDRGHIGVYSSGRYVVFTGNAVRQAPIADEQALLDGLLAGMPVQETSGLTQVESDLSDAELHEKAMAAENGEKYAKLCHGEWQDMGYPSQSEADFALLSMLAFYSPDNEQVRRVFRCTALGKREKAQRDSYLNRSLRAIRARQEAEQPSQEQVEASRALAASIPEPAADESAAAQITNYDLPPPPGLVGDLIEYFNQSARYPMLEGATLAALGLMAGVAGRAFNFEGTGLNLYLLLLAESGRGKEDMARGIERMLDAVRMSVPFVDGFVGPRKFSSGQALNQHLTENPCCLSIHSEFGLRLKELNDPRAPASTGELRLSLLELYAKSGKGDTFRATAYADRDKNTKIVKAPAISILGESTPGHVFDSLSFRDIEDGLLPRTLVIEALGDRPPTNYNAYFSPPEHLSHRFADLAATVMQLGGQNPVPIEPRQVVATADGAAALNAIQAKFDADYNDKSRDAFDRALWNRASLNIRRIAALIAVGCMPGHHSTPVIEQAHVEWAYRFVEHCVGTLASRFRAGMVGTGETRQEAELRKYIREYVTMKPYKRNGTYAVPQKIMHDGSILPLGYLRRRAKQCGAFTNDRRGFDRALECAIAALVDTGELLEFLPHVAQQRFGLRSYVYAISSASLSR